MDPVIQALAEAIWPALPVPDHVGPVVAKYMATSGAEYGHVVRQVKNIIDRQLYGPSKTKMQMLLQLMSHRLPMLLLAGRQCLSHKWPFVLSLPEMPVVQRQAMLMSWARSPLSALRKAYKGIKAVLGAVLLSHIDPNTNTNPLFEAMGFVPGSAVKGAGAGPPPASAAALEEVLGSATIHLPSVLATVGSSAGVQAYLSKRGFSTAPGPAAPNGSTSSSQPDNVDLYYDAVIVGSGAGGGVTAAVLAAAGLKVLVLEKSSWVRRADMTWNENEAFEEMYEQAGFLATEDGALTMLAGSTLGGGTKINWTASLKPPIQVRAEWAAMPHGLTHLGPDSAAFDAALDAVCSRLGVSTGTVRSPPNAKLAEGLTALGLDVEEYPRNCLSKTCSAFCNLGCRSGHKQSSEVWLQDAVRAGAHILTGVQVQQVLSQPQQGGDSSGRPRRATGVRAVFKGRSSSTVGGSPAAAAVVSVQLVVHAPVVVSSCGAVNTPALLLRSGITVGGNVGTNLRLHPAAGLVSMFPRSSAQVAAGRGAVEMHQGVSMGVLTRAAANWDSGGYGALVSVPACQPGLLAAISPDLRPGYLKEVMLDLRDAALNVVFTRDSSGGRVAIDREGRPVVSYWPCSTTQQHLIEGVITAVRAMVAAGAVRVVVPNAAHPCELQINPQDTTSVKQQQLAAFVERLRAIGVKKYDLPLFSAHQMGSCKMGTSRRSSACDPHGEVWDVSGLYIADGSVFPTPSGVNPMITIYGISYLTAQGIARRWKQLHELL